MPKEQNRVIEALFAMIAIYFWYNFLPIVIDALSGEMRAFGAILMGTLTYIIIGKKVGEIF